MLKKIFQKASVLMFFILLAAGCGSEGNSNTNGTLALTASVDNTTAPPIAPLNASATLTPIKVGSIVTFSAVQTSYDATTGKFVIVQNVSFDAFTNPQGVATWNYNFVQQSTATTLQVTAVSGGLSDVKTIAIPKFP